MELHITDGVDFIRVFIKIEPIRFYPHNLPKPKGKHFPFQKGTTMKETNSPLTIPLPLAILLPISLLFPSLSSQSPEPTPWPPQFHSILVINSSKGLLQVTDLWYDWPNGRNFNIIQHQLGKKLYDLEWDNGTSYYYTLDANKECSTRHFPVGVLRPNWLDAAEYVGQVVKDGFLCNVWKKADFITYYEDVATNRPVYWAFSLGTVAHVMTFEVGKVLDDPNWQAPVYCFQENNTMESDETNPTREC